MQYKMKFAELSVGMKARRTKKISGSDVRDFARISGDRNPIHLDEAAAAQTPFKKPVVYGILSTSLISAILGNDLPGSGTIYLGQEVKFLGPVFYDEEVTAEVEITELRPGKKIVKLATNCFKADGTQVVAGNAVVKLIE
jgi:acyl dehydratase